MKKFESVYLLQVRQYIYKLLIIAAAMTAANLILYFVRGVQNAAYGYDIVIFRMRFAYVTEIAFAVCTAMYLLVSVLGVRTTLMRYQLLKANKTQICIADILAAFTIFLMLYGFVIIDFFLITCIFRLSPSYCGGTQGILYSLTVSKEAREIIPVREPAAFLGNIAKLLLAAIAVNVPRYIYMFIKLREKKNGKEKREQNL